MGAFDDDKPVRQLKSVPDSNEPDFYAGGYDWRPVVTFGLLLAFGAFTMWLYR
jgi:hypothetical protein